jgi:adenylate cyclase
MRRAASIHEPPKEAALNARRALFPVHARHGKEWRVATTTASRKRSRRRFIELACICLVVALLGWFVFPKLDTLIRAEFNVQDQIVAAGGGRNLSDQFVFVAIDDASMKLDQLWPEDFAASPALRAMKVGWPWSRTVYADALEKILGAGAKIVLIDLILDKPKPEDPALRKVLDSHPKQIVLGSNFTADAISPDHRDISLPVPVMPAASLIADPAHDPRVGFVNFWPTPVDKVVRAAPYGFELYGHYNSFAAAALHFMGKSELIPASGMLHAFRFADLSTIPTVSFFSLFVASDWKTTLHDGAIFKDKIVVIGPSATVLQDEHLAPLGLLIDGPLFHVNALSAALHGDFYSRAQPLACIISVWLAAIAAFLIAVRNRHPLLAVASLILLCAAYIAIVYAVASFADYVLPVVQPGSALLVAGVICIAWNFAQARRESGRTRAMLERYVSRNIVREVLDNRDDFLGALGGTRRPVTVFFSDVRGFTSFSERSDAHSVVEQLNEYLGEMVGIIFRHQGTVDKFMGDGIMAVWGNVVSQGAAADAADGINAALEMLERLPSLNERWTARGLPPFAIGIGLHHGEAVFGNIGCSEKMDPTVIGDTVNLASRVEGLTKKYGLALCITHPLAELVADKFLFRSVDLVQVVGKSRPVEIVTVIGRHGDEIPTWIKNYEGGVADFRARRFVEAIEQFRRSLEIKPEDKLIRLYLARCEAFIANPPPEDWTGAEIATSK